MHPADHNLAKIIRVDIDFAREIDFKGIKCPVKIGNIHKIEKNIVLALVVLVMKTRKICNVCLKKYFQ